MEKVQIRVADPDQVYKKGSNPGLIYKIWSSPDPAKKIWSGLILNPSKIELFWHCGLVKGIITRIIMCVNYIFTIMKRKKR